MAKKNMLILAALALVGFAGSFYGGTLIAPRLMGDAETVADAEPAGPVEIDAGRVVLHLPVKEVPVIVTFKLTALSDNNPGIEVARDRFQAMVANVLEMPVITADGIKLSAIEEAVMTIAAQEAPWIESVSLELLSSGTGLAPAAEGATG